MENEVEFKCKSCSKEKQDTINVSRFIDSLDRYFKTNDLNGAYNHLKYWENEAIKLNDDRGLLSIINEEVGYSRRVNDSSLGIEACNKALELIDNNNLSNNISASTILINVATTFNCFNNPIKALEIYDKAERVYKENNKTDTFEYASLLNNKATTLANCKRYKEAYDLTNKAIDILKNEGKHDGEIAVSLINLAHIIFDNDHQAFEEVENTLDEAWKYINSSLQPHDANYAFILSKCAPSLRYFKRTIEADVCEEISREIYGGNK